MAQALTDLMLFLSVTQGSRLMPCRNDNGLCHKLSRLSSTPCSCFAIFQAKCLLESVYILWHNIS